PVLGQCTQQQDVREPEADPGRAEHGSRDTDGQRLAGFGDAFQQERERERRQETAEHPDRAAELGAEQRQDEPGVTGENERPQRPGDRVQLVQRNQPADHCKEPEPPAAEPGEPEDRRQADDRDQDPRPERAHRPPKRRLLPAYAASACSSSSLPKSGQSVSVKTSSAYASCQSRKLEMRSSPEVRISRSGSGSSGA